MTNIIAMGESSQPIADYMKLIDGPDFKITLVADGSGLFKQLQLNDQCLVILPYSASYDVYRLCGEITLRFPSTSVLLIFKSEAELNMKKALRAGADDVFLMSTPLDKVKEDIILAAQKLNDKLFDRRC